MQSASLLSRNETGAVHMGAAAALVLAVGCVCIAPVWLWPLMAAVLAFGVVCLAFRHVAAFCVAWLLLTGCTLEMTLIDLIGPSAFQPTIAVVKAMEVALAVLCALRWGVRWDWCNPALGFVVMAASGMAHGLYPGLSVADSLRSLAGSVAPFAFFFCRLPRGWAGSIIRATVWCPLTVVALGVGADALDLRPLFIDSGGARLAGLGHPAFLAGVTLAAVYAALVELYRDARPRDLGLLLANLTILFLTGARAPMACAVAVIGLSVTFVPSPRFSSRYRLLTVLAGAAVLPVLLLLASELTAARLFRLWDSDIGNLSGRQYLWPAFEAAAAGSPWLGWGVGAGNLIISPESDVAQLLHTWAAHNEYLRIEVEGGRLGRALLIGLFVVWVTRHTARLVVSERWIMRFAFIALAAHAATDNVLISTPACVLFAFVAAVFARDRQNEAIASQHSRLPGCARRA
jgi:O-antigen ligase